MNSNRLNVSGHVDGEDPIEDQKDVLADAKARMKEILDTEISYLQMSAAVIPANVLFQQRPELTQDQKASFQDEVLLASEVIKSSPLVALNENLEATANFSESQIEELVDVLDSDAMIEYLKKMGLATLTYASVQQLFSDKDFQPAVIAYDTGASPHLKMSTHKLGSHLITHAQRMMRYHLLLIEVGKRLPADHAQIERINSVVEKLTEFNAETNALHQFSIPETNIVLKLHTAIQKIEDQEEIKNRLLQQLINANYKEREKTEENKYRNITPEQNQIRYVAMIKSLLELANDPQLNLDGNDYKFIMDNIKQIIKSLDKQPEFQKELRRIVKEEAAKYSPEVVVNVKLPDDFTKRLRSDSKVVKTYTGMQTAQAKLAALAKQDISQFNLVARWQQSYYTKKMKKYASKVEYIKHLNNIAKAHEDYYQGAAVMERAKTVPVSHNQKLLAYEDKWSSANSTCRSHNVDFKHIKGDLEDMQDTINQIKRNEAEIVKLRQLIENLNEKTDYKNKYGTYSNLLNELNNRIKFLRNDNVKLEAALVVRDRELSKKFQMVLINAEIARMKSNDETKIPLPLYEVTFTTQPTDSPYHKMHKELTFTTLPTDSPFHKIHKDYKKEVVDFVSDRIDARSRLQAQRQRLSAADNDLATDIQKYNVFNSKTAARPVRKKYQKCLRDIQQHIDQADAHVAKLPHEVADRHAKLLKSADKHWKRNDSRDLTNWPLADQVRTLRELCQVMVDISASQDGLLQKANDDMRGYAIDAEAYKQLIDLLNPDLRDNHLKELLDDITRKGVPTSDADRSKDMVKFHVKLKEFKHSPAFRALPSQVQAKINELKSTIGAKFEKKKPWYSRLFGIGEKSKASKAATPVAAPAGPERSNSKQQQG